MILTSYHVLQIYSRMPQLDLNMSPATTTATCGGVCENEGILSRTSTSTSSIPIDRVLHRFEGLHINKKRSSVHLEDGCTSVRHDMVDDDGNYSKVPKLAWTSTILHDKWLQVHKIYMTSWNDILETLPVALVDRKYLETSRIGCEIWVRDRL